MRHKRNLSKIGCALLRGAFVATAVTGLWASPAQALHGGTPVGECKANFVLVDTIEDPSSPAFRDANGDGYLCRNRRGGYTDNRF